MINKYLVVLNPLHSQGHCIPLNKNLIISIKKDITNNHMNFKINSIKKVIINSIRKVNNKKAKVNNNRKVKIYNNNNNKKIKLNYIK